MLQAGSWGFFAHQRINRLAVFTLPEEMFPFFKANIQYITENAVNPDKRRYAVKGEAERHYLDADVYGDSAVYKLPRYWQEAVTQYSEDTLRAYGIVPWHIYLNKYQLTEAFKAKDAKNILRLAADLGHYIGDANVPLHTTENYNGQLTNQYGIHAFWESRLPELYSDDYDYFVGQAEYLEQAQLTAWDAVIGAHQALDSVLRYERIITENFDPSKKYTIEDRNGINVRTYSKNFSAAYHTALAGQVERQMRKSIKMIGDFWYTAWVDAGQPDLSDLIDVKFSPEELEEMRKAAEELQELKKTIREHDGASLIKDSPMTREKFLSRMWRGQ